MQEEMEKPSESSSVVSKSQGCTIVLLSQSIARLPFITFRFVGKSPAERISLLAATVCVRRPVRWGRPLLDSLHQPGTVGAQHLMDRSDDEIRPGQVVDDVQGRDEIVLALGRRTDVLSVLDKVLDIFEPDLRGDLLRLAMAMELGS